VKLGNAQIHVSLAGSLKYRVSNEVDVVRSVGEWDNKILPEQFVSRKIAVEEGRIGLLFDVISICGKTIGGH
jgi:hypothetical protein